MSDDIDNLFDDDLEDDNAQGQQDNNEQLEDDDAGSPQQQDDAGGMEEFEDDMGDEPAAAADAIAEADLFGSDDEAGEPAAEEPTGEPITVCAPLLQRPPAGKLMLLKVPNIIKVDPMAYDPESFEGGFEEVVEKGKKRLRPCDINVIRWRYRQNEDGTLGKESNARYVQWSDGSEGIMLGDELLTMDHQKLPRANTYVHVVRYDAIQGLAHMKEQVQLKPASLDSKLHHRLKMTVQKATQKSDKVRVHLAARNPEQEKAEAEKRAEDAAKLRRAQARVSERVRGPKPRVPAFTAAYIEDDEDEPDYYAGSRAAGGGVDDYYRRRGDDEEAAARLQSAKRSTPPPASIRSSKQPRVAPQVEEEEEEEEAVEESKAASGLKVRRGAILDDDDD